jgi:hypothetical protein
VILELTCPNYTVTIGYPETCYLTVKREIENIFVKLVTHELMVKWPHEPGNFDVLISVNCKWRLFILINNFYGYSGILSIVTLTSIVDVN